MKNGIVQVFCGDGYGKTNAAIGMAVNAASNHKNVIMIQFLKGNQLKEEAFLKKLEPDIKVFRFEKASVYFSDLSEEEQQEELKNIRNGLNFAKKVLITRECDVLILDEILGLVDQKIIVTEDIIKLIESKDEELDLIFTGQHFPEELQEYVDSISKIIAVKVDN